ncbi:hypothetical protein CROQUDRAFT_653651 [Cronartium quercuum f. sp. fusiforme G11]|uniref:Uncharacterized protein n=1 Tax=Cronartium quercuum f. sp. fusiforme G11 TaxID=708437 RepID=A0A9P6NTT7_9BASI|nr:hypothetical protein CROQUDRAFT_653651 [Cronartium quercuum f. sp. fusiforme G11]
MTTTFQTRRYQQPKNQSIQIDEDDHILNQSNRIIDSSKPSNHHQLQTDLSPNPDTEWVLFDPNPTTSMPQHDGRGRFSPSWNSDDDDEFDNIQSNRSINRSLTTSDLNIPIPSSQLYPANWDEEEEDLLSIPDSLSLGSTRSQAQSHSTPSSDPRSDHLVNTNSTPTNFPLETDDAALLITPDALSAGLSSVPRQPKTTSSDIAISNRSPSLPDGGRGRAWGRRTSEHYSNRSQSHRTGRVINQRRSLSRKSNQPPILRLPTTPISDAYSSNITNNRNIRSGQIGLRFLARVANRIMTVDSDTVTMLANADHSPQNRIRRPDVENSIKQNRNHQRSNFCIGDGDPSLVNGHELSSPLDLSRFSNWVEDESEHQLNHNDEDDNNDRSPIGNFSPGTIENPRWARVLTEWTNW